ncbi:guanylate kinase [Clostridia bacterium]|nr:guanylate kinase [Clostridia bacterium]
MNKQGLLIVLSGFSGVGKGTVVRSLLEQYPSYELSVSATTRRPRQQEEEGKDYFFLSVEEFKQKISEDEWLEYAEYVHSFYGTPKKNVLQGLAKGKDVILEIDVQGALQVKENFPQAILIFLLPPTMQDLYQRLKNRNTENEEQIRQRIRQAFTEFKQIRQYHYILVNDRIEDCVLRLHQLLQGEHYRVYLQEDLLAKLEQQSEEF